MIVCQQLESRDKWLCSNLFADSMREFVITHDALQSPWLKKKCREWRKRKEDKAEP